MRSFLFGECLITPQSVLFLCPFAWIGSFKHCIQPSWLIVHSSGVSPPGEVVGRLPAATLKKRDLESAFPLWWNRKRCLKSRKDRGSPILSSFFSFLLSHLLFPSSRSLLSSTSFLLVHLAHLPLSLSPLPTLFLVSPLIQRKHLPVHATDMSSPSSPVKSVSCTAGAVFITVIFVLKLKRLINYIF